jgi:hypothetical protein
LEYDRISNSANPECDRMDSDRMESDRMPNSPKPESDRMDSDRMESDRIENKGRHQEISCMHHLANIFRFFSVKYMF